MPPEPQPQGPAASSLSETLKRWFFYGQSLILLPILRVMFRLRIRGSRPRPFAQGVILAPNHQSWIDAPMVQQAYYPFPITFLMTELYYDLPLLNWYFRAAGARVVREKGPSVAGLRAARDALLEGRTICLFPEGEITVDGTIGEGQRGVARLARRTGARVVPVGIRGAIHTYSRVQPRLRLRPVEVSFGRPMTYAGNADREGEIEFTKQLMARIQELTES